MPFHFTAPLLAPGAILLPGNFGRVVHQAGYAHAHALRESVLEHTRAMEFPRLPSRLESIFYFQTLSQADAYEVFTNVPLMNLYEVERMHPEAVEALFDFRALQPNGEFGFEWARAYWRGEAPCLSSNPENYQEVLSVTPLRVLRRVER